MNDRNPPSSVEVLAYQLLRATNDNNGNPRRHYALYGHDGLVIATVEEGYYGSGNVKYLYDAEVPCLSSLNVQPAELRHVLAAAKGRGGNF